MSIKPLTLNIGVNTFALVLISFITHGCLSPMDPNDFVEEECLPSDPKCAEEDFDGDGVANQDDDFPANPLCSARGQESCTACLVGCSPSERCDLELGRCTAVDRELCDGVDNDQDGHVDEGLEADAPLAARQEGVCAQSRQRCISGAWVNPNVTEITGYEARESRCDGVDSDCDGLTDEGLTAPLSERQVGVCRGATLLCNGVDGWIEPDYQTREGYEYNEISCDGLDNDCDGQVDEATAIAPNAPLADTQFGVCHGLKKQCEGGAWVNPELSAADGYERIERSCDGVDSDCDGLIDESLDPPLSPRQSGVCLSSKMVCQGVDGWREPNYTLIESYELRELSCDGFDNDCDGVIDETISVSNAAPLATRQAGVCAGLMQVCERGSWADPPYSSQVGYEEEETACDGVDSDCDGLIDEGLSAPLAAYQLGLCQGATQRCQGTEGWQEPNYTERAGFEADEVTCDGLDNDCDGLIDEAEGVAHTAPLMTEQNGICAGSKQVCLGGEWLDPPLTAIEGYELAESACDGIDSDCDGEVDEELEFALSDTQEGVCAGSQLRCVSGQLVQPDLSLIEGYELAETTCDGVDSDCDGAVDEEVLPPLSELQDGVCFGVRQTCVEGELSEPDYTALPDYEVDEVSCDQIDNDCDGQVDEWLDYFEFSCGVGSCQRYGVAQCINGVVINDCIPGQPEAYDDCNGLDDDCDGQLDEGTGPLSERQDGVCLNTTQVCDLERGGWVEPNYQAQVERYEGQELSCDGFDNDCDGVVDEVSVLQTAPLAARQAGACAQLTRVCVEGRFVEPDYSSREGYEDGAELTCDGIDNDCDGAVDELLIGSFSSKQEGVCAESLTVCGGRRGWVDPVYSELIDRYEPRELSCDGLDNDCDGSIDEELTALALSNTQDGVCRGSRRVCDSGSEVEPDLSVLEGYELIELSCDGLDNDCDGRIDEDITPPLAEQQEGVCSTSRMVCFEGDFVQPTYEFIEAFEGEETSCDALDNDCDGSVDEGLEAIQSTCGEGACFRYGLTLCEQGVVIEDCTPGVPEDFDRCNGLDDDCDGFIDEGEGPLSAQQRGVCAGARQICALNQGGWVEPNYGLIDLYESTESSCDGLDNDCDGNIDELSVFLTAPLAVRQIGVCEGTRTVCVEAQFIEPDYTQARPQYEASEQSCDGLDNDCDGVADERLPPRLASLQDGVCANSLAICAGEEGWADPNYGDVINEYERSEQSCDGLDNDCDGTLDEDLEAPIADVQEGVCAGSIKECAGALGWQEPVYALIESFQTSESTCDGLDNDCDGATDETLSGPLASIQTGVCEGITQVCGGPLGWIDPDYAALVPELESGDVSCDGLDSDCDGLIDEGTIETCGNGVCQVTIPTSFCVGNQQVTNDCIPNAGLAIGEVCGDGLDNDCDGQVDEVSGFEICGDGVDNDCDDEVDECVSCKDFRDSGFTINGAYTLSTGYSVYCDMQSNGGGWTLLVNGQGTNSDLNSSRSLWWLSGSTSTLTSPSSQGKSQAYDEMPLTEIKLSESFGSSYVIANVSSDPGARISLLQIVRVTPYSNGDPGPNNGSNKWNNGFKTFVASNRVGTFFTQDYIKIWHGDRRNDSNDRVVFSAALNTHGDWHGSENRGAVGGETTYVSSTNYYQVWGR